MERGWFLVGDSAYGLSPFPLAPHDLSDANADVNGVLDSFNFHLSSCRIYIECAFGELVMRWGVFWRTMGFELQKCCKIIQVCMLLQNFIIDNGTVSTEEKSFFSGFDIEMDAIQTELTRQTGEMPRALVTNNNEPGRRGRRTTLEDELRQKGEDARHRMTLRLAAADLRRPLQHDMHHNAHGNIHVTS